jgi:hypothetical protein
MKHGARLAGSVCLATCMVFCLTVLCYSTARDVSSAQAARKPVTRSVSSSPSSGPSGAIISISGSDWPDPDGEQVNFGYLIASDCSIVPDYQSSTLQNGSFSGWLRWPNGTPLGVYSICATFGSTTAIANTYTVLSQSSPQIVISPSRLTAGQQATITGANFFPAGITVQLFWKTTDGRIILTLTPAISNSNGLISRTFIVPTTTFASGTYKIVASVGGGQQPTLSSSATFSYYPPTPTPIPSPTPRPASDPTPTQHHSHTAATTVGATPIVTPTIGSTATVGSQNTDAGQTPSTGPTGNAAITNLSTSMVITGGVIGFLALLTAILITVLLIRSKKAHSTSATETVGSPVNSPFTWQNNQGGSSVPGSMLFPINSGSMAPPTPLQLQVSPYAHLLHQSDGGSTGLANDPSRIAPDDPNLASIKRQVQMGLFATPGQRQVD